MTAARRASPGTRRPGRRRLRAGLLVAAVLAITVVVQASLFIAYRSIGDVKQSFASTLNLLQRYDVLDRDTLALDRAVVALDGSAASIDEVASRREILDHQMQVVTDDAPAYFTEGLVGVPRIARALTRADRTFAAYRAAPPDRRPALRRALSRQLRDVEEQSKILADAFSAAAFGMERSVLGDRRQLQWTLVGASVLELAIIGLLGWRGWRAYRRDLAAAERRVERIVDAIDEILFTGRLADGGLTALYLSKPLDALLGYGQPDDAAEGFARLRALVHPDDAVTVAHYEEALRDRRTASAEYRVTLPGGATRWVLERAHPRPTGDARQEDAGAFVVDGVLADVTDRREAQDAVTQAFDDARQLSVTDALTGVRNRRFLNERLVELTDRRPADGSAPGVILVDVDHFKRINDECGHAAGDEVLVELARRMRRVCEPRGFVGRWGGEEFMVVIPVVESDEELHRIAADIVRSAARDGFAADGWMLPVTVSAGAARREDGDSAASLVAAADSALRAAKRRGRNQALLVGDVRESDLAQEGSAVITLAQALALSASISEGMPEEHARSVADHAAAIAEEMGLPPWLVMRCRLGGWLHDVGKVAIPNAVLGKPGPLTDAEMAVVRTHCATGERIVLRVPELRDAAAAVRHHHERFDGTGYPDGLAGADIPVEARVVAAADAYATIVATRVYQPARSHDEAVAELRRSAGSHLDPEVVEAFTHLLQGDADPLPAVLEPVEAGLA